MSFTAGAGTRFVVTSASSQSSGTVLTGPITATAGTATTNTPAFDITQTWNNAGVTFTGFRFNVTDTASNASSLLMDLQVGGSSRFRVDKNGKIVANSNSNIFGASSTQNVQNWSGAISLQGYTLAFGAAGSGPDLFLDRDAANTLAQRNSTNAQTFNLYGTYTDGSNYRRVAIAMTAAGVASIAPAGLGTGASGNVLHISGLPTANPGPGILWNDAGTVKVGT